MATFLTWADVKLRYPEMDKLGITSAQLDSIVDFAEAYVHGALAAVYTVPFSTTNLTARDLGADAAFWQIQQSKSPEKAQSVYARMKERIEALRMGNEQMTTTSGATVSRVGETIWSSTQAYLPTFTMDDETRWGVDSAQLSDLRIERGQDGY